MSKMRDPFESDQDDTNSRGPDLDLSNFAPKRVEVPRPAAVRDIEAISSTNGFATMRPGTRRRRGPVRHPWTIRAPIELRREIEALGEQMDIRDDDVIRILLDHYRATTNG